jgi:hypothetical protein
VDASLPESDSFQCNSSRYLEIVNGDIERTSNTSFTFGVSTGMFQTPADSVLRLAKGGGFSAFFNFTVTDALSNQQMLHLESTTNSSTFKLKIILRKTANKAFHYRYVALCPLLQSLVVCLHAVKMLTTKESLSSIFVLAMGWKFVTITHCFCSFEIVDDNGIAHIHTTEDSSYTPIMVGATRIVLFRFDSLTYAYAVSHIHVDTGAITDVTGSTSAFVSQVRH